MTEELEVKDKWNKGDIGGIKPLLIRKGMASSIILKRLALIKGRITSSPVSEIRSEEK